MASIRILTTVVVLFLVAGALPSAHANMAPPRDFVTGLTLEKTADGPRVVSIDKGGVAAQAGLQVGDLLLGIDQRYAKLMSDADLKAFAEDPHSWPIEVIIARDGTIMTVRLAR